MIKLSSALIWAWQSNWGLIYAMNYGVIKVFSGPRPLSADAAADENAYLLGTVTTNGLPFTAGLHSNGALLLKAANYGIIANDGLWKMKVTKTGKATWYRHHANGYDPNAEDTNKTFLRMDGTVGDTLLLNNPNVTQGSTIVIGAYTMIIDYTNFGNN